MIGTFIKGLVAEIVDPLNTELIRNLYDSNATPRRGLPGYAEAFRALHDEGNIYLDVGCGDGAHNTHYQQGKRYRAFDTSKRAVTSAMNDFKNRFGAMRPEERPVPVFYTADAAEATHTCRHPIDGAIFAYSLSSMAEPAKAVEKVADAVKPGGKVVILDFLSGNDFPLRRARGHLTAILGSVNPFRTLEETIGDAPLTDQRRLWVPQSRPEILWPSVKLYTFRRE